MYIVILNIKTTNLNWFVGYWLMAQALDYMNVGDFV